MLRKKIFSIITIAILLFVCIFGTEASATNILAINTSNTSGNRASTTNASSINITSTDSENDKKNNAVSNTNKNNAVANTNKNNATTNKNTNNKSSYNNANKNASGLPYTGTSDSMLFIVAALIISAIYAYKKIRDYNI